MLLLNLQLKNEFHFEFSYSNVIKLSFLMIFSLFNYISYNIKRLLLIILDVNIVMTQNPNIMNALQLSYLLKF